MKFTAAFISVALLAAQLGFSTPLEAAESKEETSLSQEVYRPEPPVDPQPPVDPEPPVDNTCAAAHRCKSKWNCLINDVDAVYATDKLDWEYFRAQRSGKYKEIDSGICIMTQKVPGSIPLYGSYHPKDHDHYYTSDIKELEQNNGHHGWKYIGIAGYIFPTPQCGTVPLHRFYQISKKVLGNRYGARVYQVNSHRTLHYYTTNRDDPLTRSEWNYQRSPGYVFKC